MALARPLRLARGLKSLKQRAKLFRHKPREVLNRPTFASEALRWARVTQGGLLDPLPVARASHARGVGAFPPPPSPPPPPPEETPNDDSEEIAVEAPPPPLLPEVEEEEEEDAMDDASVAAWRAASRQVFPEEFVALHARGATFVVDLREPHEFAFDNFVAPDQFIATPRQAVEEEVEEEEEDEEEDAAEADAGAPKSLAGAHHTRFPIPALGRTTTPDPQLLAAHASNFAALLNSVDLRDKMLVFLSSTGRRSALAASHAHLLNVPRSVDVRTLVGGLRLLHKHLFWQQQQQQQQQQR